jgi:hypothetical protein
VTRKVGLRYTPNASTTAPRRELSADERKAYVALREQWARRLRGVADAVDRSERLTAADYAVRINARSDSDSSKQN